MTHRCQETLESLICKAYLEACEVELQAFKPGNVSYHADGHGMTVQDFVISSQVSAWPLCRADASLGRRIRDATEATRHAVGCNTNLGILLLVGPLVQAIWLVAQDRYRCLKTALAFVLQNTTTQDATDAFSAILTAKPGGLGESSENDVHQCAEVTLTAAMETAADRDTIALQYASNYTTVFDFAIPRYHCAMSRWNDERWAAVFVYTGLLLHRSDSHVERKFGKQHTSFIEGHMKRVEGALLRSSDTDEVMPYLWEADNALKAQGINPGTTADLVVACLTAVRLERLVGDFFPEKDTGRQKSGRPC